MVVGHDALPDPTGRAAAPSARGSPSRAAAAGTTCVPPEPEAQAASARQRVAIIAGMAYRRVAMVAPEPRRSAASSTPDPPGRFQVGRASERDGSSGPALETFEAVEHEVEG